MSTKGTKAKMAKKTRTMKIKKPKMAKAQSQVFAALRALKQTRKLVRALSRLLPPTTAN